MPDWLADDDDWPRQLACPEPSQLKNAQDELDLVRPAIHIDHASRSRKRALPGNVLTVFICFHERSRRNPARRLSRTKGSAVRAPPRYSGSCSETVAMADASFLASDFEEPVMARVLSLEKPRLTDRH